MQQRWGEGSPHWTNVSTHAHWRQRVCMKERSVAVSIGIRPGCHQYHINHQSPPPASPHLCACFPSCNQQTCHSSLQELLGSYHSSIISLGSVSKNCKCDLSGFDMNGWLHCHNRRNFVKEGLYRGMAGWDEASVLGHKNMDTLWRKAGLSCSDAARSTCCFTSAAF